MDLALKQRLVGASVIIALVVIFVPMIFDDTNNSKNQSISIEIPGEPEDLKHKVLSIDSKSSAPENEKVSDNSVEINRIEPIKKHETIIDVVDNSQSDKNPIIEEKQDNGKKPVPATNIDKEIKPKESENPEINEDKTSGTSPSVVVEEKTGLAYRVKFGSFSKQANAQQLKARIINIGYKATVEEDKSSHLYKVYSKHFNTLGEAESLSKKLQKNNLNIGKPSIETLNQQSIEDAEAQLDTGWIVQIGSFSNKANSMKLRDKIRNKGFVTFVDEIKGSKQQVFYRVRIGPYATREDAQVEKNNIKNKMNLNGMLKPHEKQKVIK